MNATTHVSEAMCADLVSRVLTRDEMARIQGHIVVCPDCEKRIQLAVGEAERIRSGPQPGRDRSGAIVLSSPVQPARRFSTSRWGVLGGLAAAATLAVMWFVQSPRDPGLDWIAAPELVTLRSDSVDPQLLDGLRAYDRQDAGETVRLLESAHVSGPYESIRRIYLASAYLHIGRPEDARTALDGVPMETLPPEWRERAESVARLIPEP